MRCVKIGGLFLLATLTGCVDDQTGETSEILELCAADKYVNLLVRFSPTVGSGTYEATLETDRGDGTCEAVVEGDLLARDSCTGSVDFAISAEGFGVFETPTEVSFRMVHVESGTVFETTLTPEYTEKGSETCPHPYAEIVIEPEGMPVATGP